MSDDGGVRVGVRDRTPLAAASDWLAASRDQLYQVDTTDLPDLFSDLLAIGAHAHGLAVAVVMEAQARGVIEASTSTGVAGWVRDQAARVAVQVTGPEAASWARVADQAAHPDMRGYADAVTTGKVSVNGGAVLGKELRRIHRYVPAETWQAAQNVVVDYAAAVPNPTRQLPELRDIVITQYGDHAAYLRDQERRAHADREVTRFRPEPGGLLGLHVRCDAASAAVIESTLEALSAPNPGTFADPHTSSLAGPHADPHADAGVGAGSGAVPARDSRTAGQRRFDALLDLCHAYAKDPDVLAQARNGAASRAQVVITIDWERLRDQCGYGLTSFGQPLSPQSVRAFACDSEIIPMILGSQGEILDQGRATRTATAAQWVNLRQRDRGCSFPGCDRPPGYCQAHHIRWWDRHVGPSDIDNMTLVCLRHHQVIHRDDWTAQVTPTGVHWWREASPPLTRTG